MRKTPTYQQCVLLNYCTDIKYSTYINTYDMQIKRAAATWILKTRESYRIPMESMIQDIQSLFNIAVSNQVYNGRI